MNKSGKYRIVGAFLVGFLRFSTLNADEQKIDIRLLGFSENGKYAAFIYDEENKEGDAEGGCQLIESRTTYFLDVKNNRWARPPSTFERFRGCAERRSTSDDPLSDSKARELSITPQIIGELKFTTDDSIKDRITSTFKINEKEYGLIIQEFPFKSAACSKFLAFPPQMIKVTVVNLLNKKEVVLQHDAQIPSSRGCPYEYDLHSLYLNGNNVVALIEFDQYSNEKSVSHVIGVSGILP